MKPASLLSSLATALLASALACGCGASATEKCESLCAASSQCADTTSQDCATTCAANEAEATAANCNSQYDDVLSCAEGMSDACSTSDACSAQVTALGACVDTYCEQTPEPSACKAGAPGS